MVSGLETAVWTTEDGYYWNYNGVIDTEYAEASKYQVLGSFVAAALLHVGIFGFVVYKVRPEKHAWSDGGPTLRDLSDSYFI